MHLDQQTFIYFGCLVVAVILHEISHGVVALWFGDPTAKDAGRLTLNPVPHIDPFGSIIVPALGALSGIPVVGWAKPVPVNPNRLRNPRRDMLWVGLVGPFSNFLMMAVAAVAARSLWSGLSFAQRSGLAGLPLTFNIVFSFATVNLFLGLFNLLPIPPLDGSSLVERVLPAAWLPRWHQLRPYGILVLFLLVFSTPVVNTILDPFSRQLTRFVVS